MDRPGRPRRFAVAMALLTLGALFAGCSQPRPERLVDGGFEQGMGPWHIITGDPNWLQPEISARLAFVGNQSLRTHLVPKATTGLSVIAGALQQIPATPGAGIPATLTGHYFVRGWNSTASKTYVQVVVMLYAQNGTQATQCQGLPNEYPCQLSFVLGGVSQRPLNAANRRFVFVDTAVPVQGRWNSFSLPVADAFREQWGAADPPARELRVYLEVRYEKESVADTHSADVDVYWDDVSWT